ncbi:COP9 signalosome complex subunit 7b isoform X1 [Photinus pyralis]|uniref:PCI domain-containing protein n=1 Tax=Photinus pyralis TaxID=7054 RepID=A0A1Y1LLL1_PHOPY|nr:COP9 signalosome complex subunit 7b isoform X1 [Photinus pyralis]
MVVEKPSHSNNPLEQFVLLAKSAKGAACVELIKQVLETPGVYVFGELLDMPNVQELAIGVNSACWHTLNLFAFGTYKQYVSNQSNLLELTPAQKKKLQHLTIVTLATQTKCIPYSTLLNELEIKNVRDLEDLIIEAIYADIIHGKLDQKNSQLEVDYAIGRDIQAADIRVIVDCLQKWCTACENVLVCVESQIHRANAEKNRSVQRKADIEQEIVNIKKTLKTQLQERAEGSDEVMTTDGREATASGDKGKKTSKIKGIRAGGKFWLKS